MLCEDWTVAPWMLREYVYVHRDEGKFSVQAKVTVSVSAVRRTVAPELGWFSVGAEFGQTKNSLTALVDAMTEFLARINHHQFPWDKEVAV